MVPEIQALIWTLKILTDWFFLGLSGWEKIICPLFINIFCLKCQVLPCDCFQILNLSSFCKYQLSESNLIFFHSAKKTWHRNARTFPNTLFRYRFSAFWLRSKCSICSYQLNIWYEDHVSSSILIWFLPGETRSVACNAGFTSRPCIAVPQGLAHFPINLYIWVFSIKKFKEFFERVQCGKV